LDADGAEIEARVAQLCNRGLWLERGRASRQSGWVAIRGIAALWILGRDHRQFSTLFEGIYLLERVRTFNPQRSREKRTRCDIFWQLFWFWFFSAFLQAVVITMISAIFIVNGKGEIVISRYYRDNVSKTAVDAFRSRIIAAKKTGVPVVNIDKSSFLYVRHGDLYVVAVTKANANPTLVFQFLYQLIHVFRSYFGGVFDEEQIRNNFVLIYELLDETMDHGYPQVTAVNVLTQYIKHGAVNYKQKEEDHKDPSIITGEITGNVDWRQKNKYHYKKNEVFIDVLEGVNLLMSNSGEVLKSDVSGKIIMKSYLTGMPECKFGLNDKLLMDKESKNTPKRGGTGIAIDDVTFHRCVKLGQFEHDRTVSFVPPDGEFELMKYRITNNVNLPFKVLTTITEHGKSRVTYDIKIKGSFSAKLFAQNVVIKIPTPPNVSKTQLDVGLGSAKYKAELQCLVWKIKKFPGDSSYTLKGEVKMLASIKDKTWSRPPIVMDFQVPMFTSSGLHVRYMKVIESSNYDTVKWVRYMTKSGQYQIRI